MAADISLSNKSQLLFGLAVVVILGAALSVPWFFFQSMVTESQLEVARQLADAWLNDQIRMGSVSRMTTAPPNYDRLFEEPVRIEMVNVDNLEPGERRSSFFNRAFRHFRDDPDATEYGESTVIEGKDVYLYARAIREEEMQRIQDGGLAEFFTFTRDPAVSNRLRAILLIDRRSEFAAGQLLLGRMYIIASWLFGSLLAVMLFYFILTKLILSPVRRLRETAERVQEGDLSIRADISTGDEFEQLSDAFNSMLGRVQETQAQLQAVNESLDLKVTELAEANIGLYESNRLKGEFLANVSHELRTPLNSIIGFAELLDEIARGDASADPKRLRYLNNILSSARSLLEMINDLLEMAKIEAGRMEIAVETTSIADLIEGLQALLRPQADAKKVAIVARVSQNLPLVETDPGKLQQILYNFLSNALKFSPEGGTVTIAVERVTRQDGSHGVRIGVSDQGPGIPYDMQDIIFEKFRQVDASHTRAHKGVGLGLAICRELAELLGANLSLVSEPDRGASFFVELPLVFQPHEPQALLG